MMIAVRFIKIESRVLLFELNFSNCLHFLLFNVREVFKDPYFCCEEDLDCNRPYSRKKCPITCNIVGKKTYI